MVMLMVVKLLPINTRMMVLLLLLLQVVVQMVVGMERVVEVEVVRVGHAVVAVAAVELAESPRIR